MIGRHMPLGKLREFMMSETDGHESTTHVGRSLSWWLVTYLFYALAFLFTFATAFPFAASSSGRIEVVWINLAILVVFGILILSIFVFRKILILLNCSIMAVWVSIFTVYFLSRLPSIYRIGGEKSVLGDFQIFALIGIPSIVFLTMTAMRFRKKSS